MPEDYFDKWQQLKRLQNKQDPEAEGLKRELIKWAYEAPAGALVNLLCAYWMLPVDGPTKLKKCTKAACDGFLNMGYCSLCEGTEYEEELLYLPKIRDYSEDEAAAMKLLKAFMFCENPYGMPLNFSLVPWGDEWSVKLDRHMLLNRVLADTAELAIARACLLLDLYEVVPEVGD